MPSQSSYSAPGTKTLHTEQPNRGQIYAELVCFADHKCRLRVALQAGTAAPSTAKPECKVIVVVEAKADNSTNYKDTVSTMSTIGPSVSISQPLQINKVKSTESVSLTPTEGETNLSEAAVQITLSQAGLEQLQAMDLGHNVDLKTSEPLPDFVVFEGNRTGVIMPESEKTERMQTQLSRLGTEAGKNLVDTGLLDDDEFLDFAETLSDTELAQFAEAAQALQTPSKVHPFRFNASIKERTVNLMDTLSSMDKDLRAQVLKKASELSEGVPPTDPNQTYMSTGFFAEGSAAANDIHNFVAALNKSSGDEATVSLMMEGLELYSDEQGSQLLQVLAVDTELGARLMQSLDGMGSEAQNAIIDHLADISFNMSPFDAVVLTATEPGEWSGSILGYDDRSSTVVKGMIEDIVTISENYELSDEQWQDTMTELSGIDSTGQRAFLAITRTGLETLVGSDENQKIDLTDNKAVHDVLEQLRGSQTVRELVSKSRMGEEKISDGRAFYAHKEASDSERDQQAVIETVVADAWLNKDVEGRGIHFASKVGSLGAEQRDEQIAAIHSLLETDEPLASQTVDELKENLQSFEQRTDAIVNSHDIAALNKLEQSLEDDQRQQFWSVSEVLQDSVDDLVETLTKLEEPKQAMVLEYLGTLVEQQDLQKAEEPMDEKQLKALSLDFLQQISEAVEQD